MADKPKKPLKPKDDAAGKWHAVLYYMRKRRKARAAS